MKIFKSALAAGARVLGREILGGVAGSVFQKTNGYQLGECIVSPVEQDKAE